MSKNVHKTYTYSCDACGRIVKPDGIYRIIPFDFDLCQPCLGRPFGSVVSDVSPHYQLDRPYLADENKPTDLVGQFADPALTGTELGRSDG